MPQFDLNILLYLNHATEGHPYLLKLIKFLGDNPMARGLPIFGTLTYLWFSSASIETKCRILLGMLATCFALAISLLCQHVLALHVRPIFDPSIDVANLLRWDISRFGKRIYSFPSDTAVLYFGFASVIFTINKSAGVAIYIWCLLTVGLCRVALGVHYPSDIVAALFFGSLAVFLVNHLNFLRDAMVGAMKAFDGRYLITNTVFVVFMLEAYSLFPGIQAVFANFMKVVM